MRRTDLTGISLGDREHDEQERHADAVVEAALDIETLADPCRQRRLRHDGLPERGIGGGKQHREDERLRNRERAEERRGEERTER